MRPFGDSLYLHGMPFTGLYKLDLDKGAHRVPMAQQSRRVSEGLFSNLCLALYSQYSLPKIGLDPLRENQPVFPLMDPIPFQQEISEVWIQT